MAARKQFSNHLGRAAFLVGLGVHGDSKFQLAPRVIFHRCCVETVPGEATSLHASYRD